MNDLNLRRIKKRLTRQSNFELPELSLSDIVIRKILLHWLKTWYDIRVSGLENLPITGAVIVCPNHQSHLDAYLVSSLFESKSRFIYSFAAASHFQTGLLAYLARLVGAILISRKEKFFSTLNLGSNILAREESLLMFPEGTRSRTGKLGKFQKGAALLALANNAKILPIQIGGTFELMPPGARFPKILLIGRDKPHIRIKILPPLFPFEGESTESLTFRIERSIRGNS